MPRLQVNSAHWLLAAAILLSAWRAGAAELQVRTVDGQVIQGEYLGTDENLVRIRTPYGTVSIPQKNVVTLLAVNSEKTDKPALADRPVVNAELGKLMAPPSPAATVPDAPPVKLEPIIFKEPKGVVLSSFITARMPVIPEALRQNRSELLRIIRFFAEGDIAQRAKSIRILQNYGMMAYPYIQGAYVAPQELPDKIDLLQVIALPHKPYTAELFSTTHQLAVAELQHINLAVGDVPPDYFSSRYRNVGPARPARLRAASQAIRRLESFAAVAGGPFNALFLLGVYKERYSGPSDPLLMDPHADAVRLAQTALDYKLSASGWTPPDRVLLCELAFPIYFGKKDNDDLHTITQELLKRLIPEHHPKWEAPESDWVEWWAIQKEKILKV